MKFSSAVLICLVSASATFALSNRMLTLPLPASPVADSVTPNLASVLKSQVLAPGDLSEATDEVDMCRKALQDPADDMQTFAVGRYEDADKPIAMRYGECVPLRDDADKPFTTTMFCQSASCTVYSDRECKDPVGTFPLQTAAGKNAYFPAFNFADMNRMLGDSSSCTPSII